MIVCNCFNVRERDFASLAAEGHCCLRSVRQATGLGTNCGKCIPHARAVLKDMPATARPMVAITPGHGMQIAPA